MEKQGKCGFVDQHVVNNVNQLYLSSYNTTGEDNTKEIIEIDDDNSECSTKTTQNVNNPPSPWTAHLRRVRQGDMTIRHNPTETTVDNRGLEEFRQRVEITALKGKVKDLKVKVKGLEDGLIEKMEEVRKLEEENKKLKDLL